MAKKIKNTDLFDGSLFDDQIRRAEAFLQVLREIRIGIKDSLSEQKKILTEIKTVSSVKDLRDQQAAIAEVNKATKESLKIKQEEARLEALIGKAKQELGKATEKEQRAAIQNTKLQREQLKLQKDKQKADEQARKELEKRNSLYAQESARLNDLRKRYKDMALANQQNTKEAKELNKEITKLDQKLKQVDATVGQHQRNVGNYGGAISESIKSTLFFGGAAGAASAAISGIINQAQKAAESFKEFDAQLMELSAITGLTAEEDLKFFADEALRIGSTTRVSANQYLEAVKLMGSAKPELLKNKQAMAEVTEQAILLSDATGMELPVAIENLANTMNAMELPALEAARVVNVLAAASQVGAKEVPFVSEALSKFGGVAANAGVSIEESAAAIELLGAKIPQAETVGTGLRNVILELQSAAAEQGREFEGLSGELDRLAPRLNDVVYLEKTFGKENILVAQTLIKQRDELDKMTIAVTGTATAIEQAAIMNDTWVARQEIANNKIDAAYIKVGEMLLPVMVKFKELMAETLTFIVDYGQEIYDAFNLMWDGINLILNPIQLVADHIWDIKDAVVEWWNEEEKAAEVTKQLSRLVGDFAYVGQLLAARYKEGAISLEEYANAVQNSIKYQEQFNNLTVDNQDAVREYFIEWQKGTLNVTEFSRALEQISVQNKKEKRNQEIINSLTGERIKQADELTKQYNSGRIGEMRYRVELLMLLETQEKAIEQEKQRANSIDKTTKKIKDHNKEAQVTDEIYTGKILAGEDYLEELERQRKIEEEFWKGTENAEIDALEAKNKRDREDAEIMQIQLERIRDFKNAVSELVNELTEIYIKASEEREAAIDRDIENSERRQEQLRELANKGVLEAQQSIAAEERRQAELERKKIQEQKKRERAQLANTAFESYASHVENNSKSPLADTIRDITALMAFIKAIPGFYEGTESISEANASPFKKTGRDRFLVRLDEGERVLTAEQNRRLGAVSNEDLTRIVESHQRGALNTAKQAIFMPSNDERLLLEVRDLRRAIEEKPVQSWDANALTGEIIERVELKNRILLNHYKRPNLLS